MKEIFAKSRILKQFSVNIVLDVPPTYENELIILTKKEIRDFINTEHDIVGRRYMIKFMEESIIGRSPKMTIELI